MTFNEIQATFKVTEDIAFKTGIFGRDRKDWTFTVKRQVSGCTAYGDRSCHTIKISNPENEYFMPHLYDTRYDGISDKKDEWIEFWQKFINEQWTANLELVDYSEKEINVED